MPDLGIPRAQLELEYTAMAQEHETLLNHLSALFEESISRVSES
jgi:hypothetical protein